MHIPPRPTREHFEFNLIFLSKFIKFGAEFRSIQFPITLLLIVVLHSVRTYSFPIDF